MRTQLIGILLVLALAAALPLTVSAQLNQTGSLMGTVSDNQKQPLPGVTVTIKSPSIILPQMDTLSSTQGQYRFVALPPGIYEITFTLSGFNTLVRQEIRVGLGQTTTIDAVLEQKSLTESVTVIGKSPTIDIQSTAKSTNLDRQFLTSVPAARNLDAFFNMAPGVTAEQNNSNGLMSSANGSGVRDNAFNLDGVNITDPGVGTQQYQFGIDIIEEISVLSGGMPAEFGDAMGAAVNVVTRSGGNKLSGSLSLYYNDKALESSNTAGTPLAGAQSGYQYIIEPGITLGGPVIKDRLWFFTNLSMNKRSRNIAGFPYDQTTQVPAKETRYFPYFKLTFQPSQTDRFILSYNYSDYQQDNAGASITTNADTTVKWTAPTHILNAQWMKTFSSSFFADFKVGYIYSGQNLYNKTGKPAVIDMLTNQVTGGYGINDIYVTTRFQTNANGTYFVDDFAGSHEFKAGAELQLLGTSRDFTPTPDPRNGMAQIFTLFGSPLYGLNAAAWNSKETGTSLHGYLQDSWKPTKRLTLNLGLRLTYQDGSIPVQNETEGPQSLLGISYNRSVTSAFKAFSRTALAPRLGLIYDLTGDSKTLLKASYSRYIQSNLLQYFTAANPNGILYTVQLLFPDWTPIPGAYIAAQIPSAAKVGWNGSGLKAPYTDEFSIGIERELFANWSISARYIHKADRNLVEDVDANQLDMNALMNDGRLVWTNWTPISFTDPYDGKTKTIYSQNAIVARDIYLVNPPGAKRDYDGAELTLTKHYSQGWSLMASYVWQDSKGLIGSDWFASWGGSTLYNDPNSHVNAIGQMALARRHQFKLEGMVSLPWSINFSGFFRYFSGQHYSRQIYNTDLGIPVSQGQAIIFGDTMGSYELPAQYILDLRLEKAFRLGGTTMAVFADGFNMFNGNAATTVQTRSDSALLVFGQMTAIQDPRAIRLGFRFEF
jgi:hypothetical protein